MTTDQASEKYNKLVEDVFSDKFSFSRKTATEKLERGIKDIVKEFTHDENALMREPGADPESCKA